MITIFRLWTELSAFDINRVGDVVFQPIGLVISYNKARPIRVAKYEIIKPIQTEKKHYLTLTECELGGRISK